MNSDGTVWCGDVMDRAQVEEETVEQNDLSRSDIGLSTHVCLSIRN